jgi:hypothetical protein
MLKVQWLRFGIFLISVGIAGLAWGAGAPAPRTLKELVAKAKAASNHTITMALEDDSAEVVRAKEKGFQERFGFPVRLESERGHHRDVPVKIIELAKTGRGVVDMWEGGTPLILRTFRAGNTRQPPWNVIYEGWPLAKKARADVPKIGGAPDGSALGDHCIYNGTTSWSLVYNTRKVNQKELKGIKLEDLATDKWRNRVVWDVRALGLYTLPFASGWNVERMKVYSHNLGANGTKLVSGGTTGVLQALIQGEGDISVASMTSVVGQKKLGAPVDIAFAEFVMGNVTVSCLINPSRNDADLATLFWAWNSFDGNYIDARVTGGAIFRLYEEEEQYLPLVKLARQNGITSADQVVGPKTEEDAEISGQYRKIAIDAIKAGVASKKKITR